MGWRDRRKSLLLPVAGEIFLLTLPFIERSYRTCEVLVRQISGNANYRDLIEISWLAGERTNTSSNSANHDLPPSAKAHTTSKD